LFYFTKKDLPGKTNHTRNIAAQLLFLFVVLQLFIALFTQDLCLSFDESVWHYIGRNWIRHGMTPYSGGVDNKSPLFFLIYGISDKFFGVNYWFPRVLGIVMQTVGLYYLFRLAKKLAGDKAAILALSLYGLSLLWKSTAGKHTAVTETYATALLIIAFYKYLNAGGKMDLFWSGFFAGLSICFRQTAIFGAAALFLSQIKNRKGLFLFSTGIISCIAIVLTLLVALGIDLNEVYVYSIRENFIEGNDIYHRDLLWKAENFINSFFYSELILFYPGLIGYILLKKRIDIILLWLILELICINLMGAYAREHFKNLLPPLVLANALFFAHLTKQYQLPFKYMMLIIWLCFFPKTIEPFIALKQLIRGNSEANSNDEHLKKNLGIWIKDHTGEFDRVLIPGLQPQALAYSERLSPTVYFINAPQTIRARERFVADLSSNKPKLIVIPPSSDYTSYLSSDTKYFVNQLIEKEYRYDTTVHGYIVYRQK
jgi:hypothetical protein